MVSERRSCDELRKEFRQLMAEQQSMLLEMERENARYNSELHRAVCDYFLSRSEARRQAYCGWYSESETITRDTSANGAQEMAPAQNKAAAQPKLPSKPVPPTHADKGKLVDEAIRLEISEVKPTEVFEVPTGQATDPFEQEGGNIGIVERTVEIGREGAGYERKLGDLGYLIEEQLGKVSLDGQSNCDGEVSGCDGVAVGSCDSVKSDVATGNLEEVNANEIKVDESVDAGNESGSEVESEDESSSDSSSSSSSSSSEEDEDEMSSQKKGKNVNEPAEMEDGEIMLSDAEEMIAWSVNEDDDVDDFGGVGALDTTSQIVSSLNLTKDVYVEGKGRISVDIFSSIGCPENAGAAGTFYDCVPRSLTVSNNQKPTLTDTLLMDLPQPFLTNVCIRNPAKAAVPLLWSRVQGDVARPGVVVVGELEEDIDVVDQGVAVVGETNENGVHAIPERAGAGTPNEGAAWFRLQRLGDTWHRILLIPVLGGVIVGVLHGLLEVRGQIKQSTSSQGQGLDVLAAIFPIVKAVQAAVTLGIGCSLGPDGPSVDIGKSCANGFSMRMENIRERKIALMAAGAATGIASGLNAAVAGRFFATETVWRPLRAENSPPFTTAMIVLASIVSSTVSNAVHGEKQAFTVPTYDLKSAAELPLCLILGMLCGVESVALTRLLDWFTDMFHLIKEKSGIQDIVCTALGGLGVGLIALRYPGILYWGFTNVDGLLRTGKTASAPGIWLLAQLVAAKVVATALCRGSSLVGGLYAPSLTIGAAVGAVFGGCAGMTMLQAWDRLCKCLGQDFLPYMSVVMPSLFQFAQLKPDVIVTFAEPSSKIRVLGTRLFKQGSIVTPQIYEEEEDKGENGKEGDFDQNEGDDIFLDARNEIPTVEEISG